MGDKDLLIAKSGAVLRGFVVPADLGRELVTQKSVRLFGKNFTEKDTFCEWFEVVAKTDGRLVGVCLVDFSDTATESVMKGLTADNTEKTATGLVVLFAQAQDWQIERGPYLPVYFLRDEAGDCCYLVPSAFGPHDRPDLVFKVVSSMDEIAEPKAS